MNKCTDNLTLGEIRELMKLFGQSATQPIPFELGEKVAIRTVTHYLTGKITKITGKFLTLSDAAWIADTGRFMNFIEEGKVNEVEPVTSDIRINSDTIIDCYTWRHDLPRKQI